MFGVECVLDVRGLIGMGRVFCVCLILLVALVLSQNIPCKKFVLSNFPANPIRPKMVLRNFFLNVPTHTCTKAQPFPWDQAAQAT